MKENTNNDNNNNAKNTKINNNEKNNNNINKKKEENKIITEIKDKKETNTNENNKKINENIKKDKDENIKKDKDDKNKGIINVIKNEIEKEEKIIEEKKIEENTNQIKQKEKSPTKIITSVVTTGKEKINDIYLKKVNDLSNIYNYTSNYLAFISLLFKKISEPFYSKLSSSYINNVKPYLKYFKELVNILFSFSEKLNLLNSSVEDKKEDNDDENLIRVENNLNSAVKKLNVIFADTTLVIAKNLKENILSKPLFAKYDTIESKFEENFHKMLNLISQFEQYRIKYNNEYNKKYTNIFNMFIQKYNELDNYLITMKDFFIIEYDIIDAANHSLKKVTKFIEDIKKLFDETTNVFCDYLEILKTMIKIYYEENKKIILPNILSEKMINDLEKLVGQDIRKNIEKKFCIKNIIEHYQDEALRNDINHLLLKYQDILVQFKVLKNEEINNLSHFNLKYFKSTEIFFTFLFTLIPPKFQVNYEDVIQFKTDVKRDCGLFKGWKDCHLVISYQGHILFFDEEVIKTEKINIRSQSEHAISAINTKELDIKKNTGLSQVDNTLGKKKEDIFRESKLEDDFKKGEARYGIVPDKLSIMYYKTSYGIKKKNKKQGKYLFEIWEKGIGNKKNKINIIDALDLKNLENILLELTENNIYDD